MSNRLRWLAEPEEHDYPAAVDFLSLMYSERTVNVIVANLRLAETTSRKAKDILRASGLPALSPDDADVAKDIAKIRAGKKLSPILLVIGSYDGARLVIADGYHRVCAAYHAGDDTPVPCRAVTINRGV